MAIEAGNSRRPAQTGPEITGQSNRGQFSPGDQVIGRDFRKRALTDEDADDLAYQASRIEDYSDLGAIIEARSRIAEIGRIIEQAQIQEHLGRFSREYWSGAGAMSDLTQKSPILNENYRIGLDLAQRFPWRVIEKRMLRTRLIDTIGEVGLLARYSPRFYDSEEVPPERSVDGILLGVRLSPSVQVEIPHFKAEDLRNLAGGILVPLERIELGHDGRKIRHRRPIEDVSADIGSVLAGYGEFSREAGITAPDFIMLGNRKSGQIGQFTS